MRIGNGTKIFANPRNVLIDETRPWLIHIGSNVQITSGVKILTHGYDWSVIKGTSGEILGSSGKVTIGNNCFIGMNTVILKGTTIGDNVIIGAQSLVRGKIPSNTVAAGTPCKVIMSLEEYKQKRIEAQVQEAKELVKEFFQVYKKSPSKKELTEFFWLFSERDQPLPLAFENKMKLLNNYDFSMKVLKNTKPLFSSYDEFIEYCLNR